MWSAYSEAKKTQVHQEALRGSVPEAVNQQVKEGKERMETLKAELHLLSFYMCRDEPEFVEEEIEIKSGFEGLSITTFDNTTSNYNGPFADREEHIFYTVVPKLEELLPSLHLKRGKKTDSDNDSDDVSDSDSEFEDEAKIEDEMKRLDAGAAGGRDDGGGRRGGCPGVAQRVGARGEGGERNVPDDGDAAGEGGDPDGAAVGVLHQRGGGPSGCVRRA